MISRLSRASLLLVAAISTLPASAQTFYWAGEAGDAATAGAGRWDRNDSVVWREADPAGVLVKWTDGRTAVFRGTAGGTVTIADPITVPALVFEATADSFILSSGAGTVTIDGGGISCHSPHAQTLAFHTAILTFSNHATAGAGERASHVQITSDGLTNFTDDSTAGRATLVNSGELKFAGHSSAADAALTNSSLLIFMDEAKSGAAAITNQGQLTIQDHAHDFGAAAFSNGTGGLIDVSTVAAEEPISFSALTNADGATLIVGRKKLTVGHLQLVGENDLNFDLAADSSGSITVSTSLFVTGSPRKTRLGITDAGGMVRGQTYRLIDWSAAVWTGKITDADFALSPLPTGFTGKLKIDGKSLSLVLTP